MKVHKWEEVRRERAFDDRWKKLDRVFFIDENGIERDRLIKLDGDAVVCLALTPDKDVVMAKQFRPGPQEVLMEMPGGGLKPGEDPAEALARELLEETGYAAGRIEMVTSAWDCAYSNRSRKVFVAHDCVKEREPDNDPNEPVEVVLISLEEFRAHLRTGQLTDVEAGYLVLDFLNLL